MFRKRTIVIFLFLVLIMVGSVYFIFLSTQTGQKKKTSPLPTPTPFQTTPRKITISGIEMNNFTVSPVFVNQNGDTSFVRNSKFEFVYLKQFNEFIINIYSSPVDQNRYEAENLFLEKLGINQEQACTLTVWVSNTSDDPQASWAKQKLSFCPK